MTNREKITQLIKANFPDIEVRWEQNGDMVKRDKNGIEIERYPAFGNHLVVTHSNSSTMGSIRWLNDEYKADYADTPPSIYIIGSLSQANQIKKVADSIKDANVRYVQPEPAKTFNECVSTCFDNIEWANSIYVVLKPDGTIGQGVTYELEYAKRLNKEIQYISDEELVDFIIV